MGDIDQDKYTPKIYLTFNYHSDKTVELAQISGLETYILFQTGDQKQVFFKPNIDFELMINIHQVKSVRHKAQEV